MSRPDPLTRLIEQLQRLPGIGAKSAQRLAFHVLKTPREDVERLAEAMRDVKDRVTYCSVCSNITDADPCYYCTHPSRDHRLICVVEEPENVGAIEKTRDFKGVYHVLMGALSPLHGVGPDDLKIKGLLTRVASGGVEEVILATNPNVEGEATAGGGMVTVVINGAKQIQSLKIDPEAVSKDDVEMLQDLILAAINDAQRKADEAMSQQMSGMMGGMKIPGLF